jgi:hypothetical protein
MVRPCCVTGEKDSESTGRRKKQLGEWLNVIVLRVCLLLNNGLTATDERTPIPTRRSESRVLERVSCHSNLHFRRFSYGFGKQDIKEYKSEDSEAREL